MRDYVAIQQKFSNWLDIKSSKGHSFNQQLLLNREFHSPGIEGKLLDFVGLSDKGSNLYPRDFDPEYIPPEADYEKLSKEQRESWEVENKVSNINQPQQQFLQEKKKQIILERMYNSNEPKDIK